MSDCGLQEWPNINIHIDAYDWNKSQVTLGEQKIPIAGIKSVWIDLTTGEFPQAFINFVPGTIDYDGPAVVKEEYETESTPPSPSDPVSTVGYDPEIHGGADDQSNYEYAVAAYNRACANRERDGGDRPY